MTSSATANTPTTTTDHNNHRHMNLENLPHIDLRLLSQSELLSLSRCVSTRPPLSDDNEEDEESNPKIDPSVFNESAGSRKQTFYRLRLAPPRGVQDSEKPSSSSLMDPDDKNSTAEENSKISSVLKSLFSIPKDDEAMKEDKFRGRPRKIENQSNSGSNGSDILSDGVTDVEGMKKRGRPRKSETEMNHPNAAFVGVSEEKGQDMALRGRVEDPYAEEITRQTEGFNTQEQLFGFLNGLNGGEWMSAKRKRMIVDASVFGNLLPQGWKLILTIKKNAGHFWLVCQRYISPNGQQFVSWKEVATYFFSISQPHRETQPSSDHISGNIQLPYKLDSENALSALHNDKNEAKPISCSAELNDMSKLGMTGNIKEGALKCHKCPAAFATPDDFCHHLYHCHKKEKLEHNGFEAVIMKDGTYECQLCQKSFEEKRRYNGHLGSHIRKYVKKALRETQTSIPPPDTTIAFNNFVTKEDAWDGFVASSASNQGNMAFTGLIKQQQEGSSTISLTASNDKLNIFKDQIIPMSGSMNNINQDGRSNGQTSDAENNVIKVPSQQSSSYFPSFDILMDKDDSELFRMVGNPSNFGAPASSNTEQIECDFLRAQTNSYSEDPKVFAYGPQMGQGFDTSMWFEQENLNFLPKTSGGIQQEVVNACVWCGNEIQQGALELGQQTGSIGFMCNSCKAKFSN
ncbi:hypothetical protein ACFE04_013764 [Oxalis oulophora]